MQLLTLCLSLSPCLVARFQPVRLFSRDPLSPALQVVLPPGGGRLVLATDGVWGHTCAALRRTMRAAPVEAAAQLVIKALR